MIRRLLIMIAAAAWCTSALAQSAAPPAVPGAAPPADIQFQPSPRDDRETIEAAQTWLALVDAGKFGLAWDDASPHLKSVVTRAKWIAGMSEARKPFGKLKERTPARFARSHSMPGAPEGDYSIIEFETEFANGKRATEQIIWMLGDNGVWRVSGYYIR